MKLTRLATMVALSSALTILIVGIVSAAPARSNQSSAHSAVVRYMDQGTPEPTETPEITHTEDLTSTTHMTQPVALAISLFFSGTYSDVISLHNAGFGFGEIARAYFIANLSKGSVTPQQVLDLAAGGMGWGEIMKQYAFKPGHGNNLGAIMRGDHGSSATHGNSVGGGKPNCPGNSCNAPGQSNNNH
jgi:hypothetical protein